jgi:hypothetical protein
MIKHKNIRFNYFGYIPSIATRCKAKNAQQEDLKYVKRFQNYPRLSFVREFKTALHLIVAGDSSTCFWFI